MYKRIVFFQPRTIAENNYQNADGKEQCWAPWFALTLSPIARIWGLEVDLVDARITQERWRDKIGSLTNEDVFAVSVITGHAIVDAVAASKIAKNRGAYVIWGGPHVTLFPSETLKESPADAVISGFGFDPFWEFVALIVNPDHESPGLINRIFYKELPIKISSLDRSTRKKISYKNEGLLPFDLHLVPDWSKYVNPDIAIAPRTINFITSEGCPRPCTFCSEPSTSKNIWYTRSIEQSINTCVELVDTANANGLKLHDPNFFHKKERALEFAIGLAKHRHIPWAATIHPDDLNNMSDEMLIVFRDMGLSRILTGLESPYPQIIKMAGKKYDPHLISVMAKRLANLGIRGMFTFIVGWPNADRSHYKATIECAYKIKRIWSEHQAKIHFLEPWPGTPIYQLLIRQGFKYPSSLEEWAKIDYYQAQFMQIHDQSIMEIVKNANSELSPYVNA